MRRTAGSAHRLFDGQAVETSAQGPNETALSRHFSSTHIKEKFFFCLKKKAVRIFVSKKNSTHLRPRRHVAPCRRSQLPLIFCAVSFPMWSPGYVFLLGGATWVVVDPTASARSQPAGPRRSHSPCTPRHRRSLHSHSLPRPRHCRVTRFTRARVRGSPP